MNSSDHLLTKRRVTISNSRYGTTDWDDLWRRLYLHAAKLTSGINAVIDCGVSADDLVQETLEKFLRSPNGLGWRESKGSLPVFLGKVLQNSFIDHIRREGKIIRPDAEAGDASLPTAYKPALTDDLAFQALQNRLLALIKGRKDEQELADFILAASMTTSEGKLNQQFADLLSVDEGEVINRRNKLLRITGVKKLREEIRNGREGNKGLHKRDRPTAGGSPPGGRQ